MLSDYLNFFITVEVTERIHREEEERKNLYCGCDVKQLFHFLVQFFLYTFDSPSICWLPP